MAVNRIANKDARSYVKNRQDFIGSNTRGSSFTKVVVTHKKDDKWHPAGKYYVNKLYVVHTYDAPLFVYDPDTSYWFENTTRYSVTSSKHRSQLHPHTDTIPMDEMDIRKLLSAGSYKQLVKEKVNG